MRLEQRQATVRTLCLIALLSSAGLRSGEVAAWDGLDHRSNFGERLAGLYFVTDTTTGARHLISLWADGNFQGISSEQEGGIPEFNPFSDQVGTWKRTGRRQITAKVIDMTYNRDPMTLFGFGVVRYVLTFDKGFKTATGKSEGGAIGPSGNPNDLDAQFLFTFAASLTAERVPIRFPQGFPNQ